MDDELPRANWKEQVLFYFGRRKAFLVEGDSMLPTLKDGDVVLIDPNAPICIDAVVVARHPYRSNINIIKRVGEINSDGLLTLTGDSPTESTDSRVFGAVSIQSIIGCAVCKLK